MNEVIVSYTYPESLFTRDFPFSEK